MWHPKTIVANLNSLVPKAAKIGQISEFAEITYVLNGVIAMWVTISI